MNPSTATSGVRARGPVGQGGGKFSAAADKYKAEIVNIRTKKDDDSAAIVESFGILGKVHKKSVHFSNITTGR